MAVQTFLAAALAASLPLIKAQGNTDNGNIAACHSQSCQDCPIYASVNEAYPNCITYPSSGNLDGYEAESGHGYDVWWNSGQPAAGCKIIVRTPASTDLPACGYYERGWSNAGCYYVLIQQSFMLQYCCGTGDCDAATPGSSVNEVHTMQAQGITGITSLQISNMTADNGKRDIDGVGEISWSKRSPSSMSQLARDAAANVDKDASTDVAARGETQLEKRDCKKYTESNRYTKGGRQVKVSPTQNCNSNAGCSIEISSSVSTGYSVSVSVGFNILDLISAETSLEFHEEKTRSISNTYTQASGTRGYVSFIPTYVCTDGPVSECDDDDIKNGDDVTACTPRLIGSGENQFQDGTYSFVYE